MIVLCIKAILIYMIVSRFVLLLVRRTVLIETIQEILPSAALLKANDKIFVEEVISTDKKKGESGSSGSISGGHSSNSSSKSKNSNVNRFFLDLSTVTFAVVVSIYAIAIAQPDSLSQCFKAASDFTQDAIIFYPIKPQVLSDAFIAFITWSLSYMFIRRLPNPENGCSVATLRKFSPDMLFGGLAASSAVLLKALVSAHIPKP